MMKWTVRISSRHQVWDDNSNGTKYQTVFFTALSDLSKRHCSRQAKRGQPAIVQSVHTIQRHSSENSHYTAQRIQTSDLACQVSSLHHINHLRKLAAGIFLNARWSAPLVSLLVSVVYMYMPSHGPLLLSPTTTETCVMRARILISVTNQKQSEKH